MRKGWRGKEAIHQIKDKNLCHITSHREIFWRYEAFIGWRVLAE